MKAGILSFTKVGRELAEKIAEVLRERNDEVHIAVKCSSEKDSITESAAKWTKRQFGTQDTLIFVGAAGIAVRLIAPYVCSKTTDPAVLVVDEGGSYCIPVLSGHIGGANELARYLCGKLRMLPVITTATDNRGTWAVDVFAANNNLYIESMEKAKNISARLLAGERLTVSIEDSLGQVLGEVPKELTVKSFEEYGGTDVRIGIHRRPDVDVLCLVPRVLSVGIGCRKGTPEETIERAVKEVLEREEIFPESLEKLVSIDLKAEEEGIHAYCRRYGLGFETYSAEELNAVEGEFEESEFVQRMTGVGNVCERSACRGSGGVLLVKKQIYHGVTVALAARKWSVYFG